MWKEIWEDWEVRVAILTGAGDRHFCAGHNLAPPPGVTEEDRERIRAEGIFWPMAGTVNGANIGADGRLGDHYPGDIQGWPVGLQDQEAAGLLQEAGVPAGPSLDISRVFHESQLREGGYFTNLQTSDGVLRDLPGLPWRFEGEPEPRFTAAPVLGQHNAYVYRELLGLSQPEVDRLVEEQIIY